MDVSLSGWRDEAHAISSCNWSAYCICLTVLYSACVSGLDLDDDMADVIHDVICDSTEPAYPRENKWKDLQRTICTDDPFVFVTAPSGGLSSHMHLHAWGSSMVGTGQNICIGATRLGKQGLHHTRAC